jgi:hypothetical protein
MRAITQSLKILDLEDSMITIRCVDGIFKMDDVHTYTILSNGSLEVILDNDTVITFASGFWQMIKDIPEDD